jgi:hypothetical protein
MRDSVQQGISETEGEIDKVAQSAKVDPYDNPFADPPAAGPSPQAELPLDEGGRRKAEGGSDVASR